jgi:F-type H+-transporting ATPase subunit epsilon
MSLRLRILTPTGEALSTEVSQITLPGLEGEFTILRGHLPFLTALKIGTAYFPSSKHVNQYLALGKGFAEIFNDQVTLFVQTAEKAQDIDKERAQAAFQRAEKQLATQPKSSERPLILDDLARAKARLKASQNA